MQLKTELNHEGTKARKSLSTFVPWWLTIFLSSLLFSFPFFSCASPQKKSVARTPTRLGEIEVVETIPNFAKYPIVAEKDNAVLVAVAGTNWWAGKVSREITFSVITNEHGMCEVFPGRSNIILIYENPDITSKVIDIISSKSYATIVEYKQYFSRILTPAMCEGWIENKNLNNFVPIKSTTGVPIVGANINDNHVQLRFDGKSMNVTTREDIIARDKQSVAKAFNSLQPYGVTAKSIESDLDVSKLNYCEMHINRDVRTSRNYAAIFTKVGIRLGAKESDGYSASSFLLFDNKGEVLVNNTSGVDNSLIRNDLALHGLSDDERFYVFFSGFSFLLFAMDGTLIRAISPGTASRITGEALNAIVCSENYRYYAATRQSEPNPYYLFSLYSEKPMYRITLPRKRLAGFNVFNSGRLCISYYNDKRIANVLMFNLEGEIIVDKPRIDQNQAIKEDRYVK